MQAIFIIPARKTFMAGAPETAFDTRISIKSFHLILYIYNDTSNRIWNRAFWIWRKDKDVFFLFFKIRSEIITTYALCGFANVGSMGVQLGGISVLTPNKRSTLSKLVLRALVAGTLACFMTACIAGKAKLLIMLSLKTFRSTLAKTYYSLYSR